MLLMGFDHKRFVFQGNSNYSIEIEHIFPFKMTRRRPYLRLDDFGDKITLEILMFQPLAHHSPCFLSFFMPWFFNYKESWYFLKVFFARSWTCPLHSSKLFKQGILEIFLLSSVVRFSFFPTAPVQIYMKSKWNFEKCQGFILASVLSI